MIEGDEVDPCDPAVGGASGVLLDPLPEASDSAEQQAAPRSARRPVHMTTRQQCSGSDCKRVGSELLQTLRTRLTRQLTRQE